MALGDAWKGHCNLSKRKKKDNLVHETPANAGSQLRVGLHWVIAALVIDHFFLWHMLSD